MGISLLAVAAVVLCAHRAAAQSRDVDPRFVFDQPRPLSYASIRMSHFGRGPLDRIMEPISRQLINLEDNGGPSCIAYYTQMFQPGSQGGANNWTVNHELDTYLRWELVQSPSLGTGTVYTYFYHIEDNVTGTDTQQFADAIGSAWLTNYNDADGVFNALDVLVWEQSWNDGQFEVLIGQMDPGVFFDLSHYAGDDTGYFFAEPLATNPVRAFPLAGLGILVSGEPAEWLKLLASVSDADPDGRYPDFRSLGNGRWFYVGEVVLRPEFGGHRGNYRIAYYGIDPTETKPRGRGLALSFDQQFAEDYGLFFRFGQADGRRRDLRKFMNVGMVCLSPGGWKNDRAGVGLIWGQPTDRTLPDQYGLELFYRWQCTARMEFSPDLQIIFDPAQTDQRETAVVGGMRVRWTF